MFCIVTAVGVHVLYCDSGRCTCFVLWQRQVYMFCIVTAVGVQFWNFRIASLAGSQSWIVNAASRRLFFFQIRLCCPDTSRALVLMNHVKSRVMLLFSDAWVRPARSAAPLTRPRSPAQWHGAPGLDGLIRHLLGERRQPASRHVQPITRAPTSTLAFKVPWFSSPPENLCVSVPHGIPNHAVCLWRYIHVI